MNSSRRLYKNGLAALSALGIGVVALSPPSQAVVLHYSVVLSGTDESPPNASPGSGSATLDIDDSSHVFSLAINFMSLLGNTTVTHIHCCTASPGAGNVGVASATPTFPGFPIGVTSGSYARSFDMNLTGNFSPVFLTFHGGSAASAYEALLSGINSGSAYLNIHTTLYPGGEIRGFLQPISPVPVPAALPLLVTGVGIIGALRRQKRRAS